MIKITGSIAMRTAIDSIGPQLRAAARDAIDRHGAALKERVARETWEALARSELRRIRTMIGEGPSR